MFDTVAVIKPWTYNKGTYLDRENDVLGHEMLDAQRESSDSPPEWKGVVAKIPEHRFLVP